MAKDAKDRRTCYLSVTMTEEQEAKIIRAADDAGQSKSTYALRAILAQADKDRKSRRR